MMDLKVPGGAGGSSTSGGNMGSTGFKGWLSKISSRFRRMKPSDQVRSPLKPLKAKRPEPLVIDDLEATRMGAPSPTPSRAGGDSGDAINLNQSVFTLGFAAATTDLSSYQVCPMAPPEFLADREQGGSGGARGKTGGHRQKRRGGHVIPDGRMRRSSSSETARRSKSASATEAELRKMKERLNKGGGGGKGHSRNKSNQSDPGVVPGGAAPSSFKGPPPRDVRGLLRRLDLSGYAELFEREEVDLEALQELTSEDLLEMGVHSRSARKAILHAAEKLRREEN